MAQQSHSYVITPKKWNHISHISVKVFMKALFIIAPNWENPSVNQRWMDKQVK